MHRVCTHLIILFCSSIFTSSCSAFKQENIVEAIPNAKMFPTLQLCTSPPPTPKFQATPDHAKSILTKADGKNFTFTFSIHLKAGLENWFLMTSLIVCSNFVGRFRLVWTILQIKPLYIETLLLGTSSSAQKPHARWVSVCNIVIWWIVQSVM